MIKQVITNVIVYKAVVEVLFYSRVVKSIIG